MRLFDDATLAEYREAGVWTDETWDDLLAGHVSQRGDRLALADPPNRSKYADGDVRRLTWRQVDELVDQVAAHLVAGGVRVGAIVGVQMPNIVELPVTYLALTRIGAIASPFPVQYRQHELKQLLSFVGAEAFITCTRVGDRDNVALVTALGADVASLGTTFAWGPPTSSGAAAGDVIDVIDLDVPATDAEREALAKRRAEHQPDANDCFTVCWTSGTESLPKGIPRGGVDWVSIGKNNFASTGGRADDVFLNPMPMVNMGGLGGMFCPWLAGGVTMVMHHPFDADTFLTQIADEKVTFTLMPPALLSRLVSVPGLLDQHDISSLRTVTTGSAPVPGSIIEAWTKLGVDVINVFASNEGLSLYATPEEVPNPDQRGHLFASYRHLPPNATLASRYKHVKLIDLGDGTEINEPGHPGELRFKSPSVFAGYYGDPPPRVPFDDDGYYISGDVFEFADESLALLEYKGRSTDLIVRGGFNVSPAEIESLVQPHPDVLEVAVVGKPDPELGERIAAFVVPQQGAVIDLDSVVAYLEAAEVAKFKWPEVVIVVDELPRNPIGKVLHRELRARFESGDAGD